MEELNRRDIAILISILTIDIEKNEKDYKEISSEHIKKLTQQTIEDDKIILSKLSNIIEKYY